MSPDFFYMIFKFKEIEPVKRGTSGLGNRVASFYSTEKNLLSSELKPLKDNGSRKTLIYGISPLPVEQDSQSVNLGINQATKALNKQLMLQKTMHDLH